MNVIRSTLITAAFGLLAGAAASYLLVASSPREPDPVRSGVNGPLTETALEVEAWPICSAMGLMVESADWAALDPDFAAGKRAIVAGDWNRAIESLRSAGLRDPRNADIQNYLGYVYRRLRQIDRAMQYYGRAVALNPRHRSAHEHLGEAYVVQGELAKAREHLAALEQICLIPCEEYDDLKRAIAEYSKLAKR
jgi:tetratricopeptide (TPR) repeat protein